MWKYPLFFLANAFTEDDDANCHRGVLFVVVFMMPMCGTIMELIVEVPAGIGDAELNPHVLSVVFE